MYEVVDITPDTPEWEQERRSSIGASEAAAAIGRSAYGNTPLEVYLGKLGRRTNNFDPILSLIGHGAEPMISEWVERWHPEVGEVKPGFMARNPQYPWLHATFDRVVVDRNGVEVPLQLKTSSVYAKDKWFDGVPVDYKIQEQVECLVMGAPYALLAVWHTGTTDFGLYKIIADAQEQAAIASVTGELWECIQKRTPPPFSLGDNLAELFPADDSKVIEADADIMDALEFLKETAAIRIATNKEYVAQENEIKFELEKRMKEATKIIDPITGETLHTWKLDAKGVRRHYTKAGKK